MTLQQAYTHTHTFRKLSCYRLLLAPRDTSPPPSPPPTPLPPPQNINHLKQCASFLARLIWNISYSRARTNKFFLSFLSSFLPFRREPNLRRLRRGQGCFQSQSRYSDTSLPIWVGHFAGFACLPLGWVRGGRNEQESRSGNLSFMGSWEGGKKRSPVVCVDVCSNMGHIYARSGGSTLGLRGLRKSRGEKRIKCSWFPSLFFSSSFAIFIQS